MASVSADAANDVGSEVALLWAVVLPMTDLATVLAGLVLIITESTVKSGKLAQLVTLQLILSFWNGCGLNNVSLSVCSLRSSNIQSQ